MSTFSCEQDLAPSIPKNYRTRSDNPLVYLKKYSGNDLPSGMQKPDEKHRQAMDRLLGRYPVVGLLRNIYRANASVFTEKFRETIHAVLNEDAPSGLSGIDGNTRTKTGSLEVPWSTHDIPLTKHHIIPKMRGGGMSRRNLLWLPRSVHDDFHDVFGVYTPVEQLAYVSLLFSDTTSEKFRNRIKDALLSQSQNSCYEKGIVENGKIIH